jgi:transposase
VYRGFVGIDVAKARNAIAVADGERGGEIRYLGEVDASTASMCRVIKRIAAKHEQVHFCYEAGRTGYGLYRLITALGHPCMVVAPSLISGATTVRGYKQGELTGDCGYFVNAELEFSP